MGILQVRTTSSRREIAPQTLWLRWREALQQWCKPDHYAIINHAGYAEDEEFQCNLRPLSLLLLHGLAKFNLSGVMRVCTEPVWWKNRRTNSKKSWKTSPQNGRKVWMEADRRVKSRTATSFRTLIQRAKNAISTFGSSIRTFKMQSQEVQEDQWVDTTTSNCPQATSY